jgi:hypothetical protein
MKASINGLHKPLIQPYRDAIPVIFLSRECRKCTQIWTKNDTLQLLTDLHFATIFSSHELYSWSSVFKQSKEK